VENHSAGSYPRCSWHARNLPSSPSLVNNGTYPLFFRDLGGNQATSGVLTLVDGTVQDGTIAAASYAVQNGTISANISGSGPLSQIGGGTVVLSGDNSYTGGTYVGGNSLLSRPLGRQAGGATAR
jgi:autotransporter-associated beta strand protein